MSHLKLLLLLLLLLSVVVAAIMVLTCGGGLRVNVEGKRVLVVTSPKYNGQY